MKIRTSPRAAQAGFTIIELIVVIVILGILAATALPKFVDMSGDAKLSAVQGVAGAAASAMTLNYSGCLVTNHAIVTDKCAAVDNCSDVTALMQGDALPAKHHVVAAAAPAPLTRGATFSCTIERREGATVEASATFNAVVAGV